MRRSKELVILAALLIGAMVFVLGYVLVRRAKNQSTPRTAAADPLVPHSLPAATPVDLAQHEGKTVDFSSGQPVIRSTAADQAALDSALKEMAAATQDVVISPPAPSPTSANP